MAKTIINKFIIYLFPRNEDKQAKIFESNKNNQGIVTFCTLEFENTHQNDEGKYAYCLTPRWSALHWDRR